MNSTGNTKVCPRCYWHISPKDIFCGGCAYQLASITVTPDPDDDPGGATWTIFSGIPITLKVKNEGVNPIEIQKLKAQGFEITHSNIELLKTEGNEIIRNNIELPYSLDTDETLELRCSHNAPEGSIRRLELLSSLSSIKPIDFFVRCEKAPEISLVSAGGHEFEHVTDEYQPCAIDSDEERVSLTLRHDSDSPLVLQTTPFLSEGKDYFDITGLPHDQKFPDKLSPKRPLKFSLTRRQDFDETCRAVLNFSFDSLGEIIFRLLLRDVNKPKIEWEFSREFTNEQALISGGKKKINFTTTITHSGGLPLRITRVESNQDYLGVNQISEQDSFIDESSVQIDLVLNQDTLPTVEENTTEEATLNIHGTTIGENEPFPFHEPIVLPVQIRPPQPLNFPIAVDFGTTNSCIAYIDPQDQNRKKRLEIDLNTDVSEMRPSEIPTILQFLVIKNSDDLIESKESSQELSTDERWVSELKNESLVKFGQTLKDLRFESEDISSISWGFKRTLKMPDETIIYRDRGTGSISLNGRIYSQGNRYIEVDAIEKIGLYIRFLLESFQENTGYVPSEAVFTYPAVFNRQKEALRKAIAWATQGMDLKPILEISEPEAIALNYAMDIKERNPGQDIVYGVFDCGGGTTDISIVRSDGRLDIEFLASDGDGLLGGDLLAFKIAQYLYLQMVPEVYRTQFPFPDTLDKALRLQRKIEETNFSRLYELAEKIKENNRIKIPSGEKGILDLIESSNIPDDWPDISLTSFENDTLRIQGTKRTLDLDDTLLPDMKPLAIDDIYNAVRKELEKGFDKLNQMKEQIDNVELDYLILEGNASRFPLIKRVAEERAQAKEIIFKPEKLKKSVVLGAIAYGESLRALISPLRIKGIHKLNYPICMSAFTHFVPIFDRWTPLTPNTTIISKNPLILETERPEEIELLEFFGWDLNTIVTQAEYSSVANLPVPNEEDIFQNAQFWTYYLELRCDAEGKASLWYNYRVGNEEDGSDFEDVWETHRKCENFSYT